MLKLCSGCRRAFRPEVMKRGRCPDCLRAYSRERGSTRARGYGGYWQQLSAAVLRRDNYVCRYCGERATTADHVVPKSKGGTDAMNNLVAACRECNSGKRDRVFLEGGTADPQVGSWEKNFTNGVAKRDNEVTDRGFPSIA